MEWPCGLSSATPEAIGELLLATAEGGFMEWTRILAYITGNVDQELLLRNEYLAAENRILRAKLKSATAVLRSRTGDARRNWLLTRL